MLGHNEVRGTSVTVNGWRIFRIMDIVAKKNIPLPTLVPVQNAPQETYRALIGWANGQWSIEARSSVIKSSVEDHLRAISASKLAIASRSFFTPANPIRDLEDGEFLSAIKERPEMAYLEASIKKMGATCRFARVNLKDVLVYQPLVKIDDMEDEPIQNDMSEEQLYQACFPSSLPVTFDEVAIEFNDAGCKITTHNPNIRVVNWGAIPFPGEFQMPSFNILYPGIEEAFQILLLPFALIRHPNYFQVIQHLDRFFVRDGYHRGTRFLRQGIETVPCLFIQASNLAQLGWKPDMIDLPHLFSPHPPRLCDFWDDEVSCSFVRPALQQIWTLNMGMTAMPR